MPFRSTRASAITRSRALFAPVRWLTALWLVLTSIPSPAANYLTDPPERRVEQFPTDSGRLILPLPYNLPGIGNGYFLLGYFSNMFDTTTDALLVKVVGDAEGYDAQLDELPLYRHNLFLNVMEQRIDKAAVNNYQTRGMNTGKYDYNIVEVNRANESDFGLTLSLYERRIELNSTRFSSDISVTALRDPDGNLIKSFSQDYPLKSASWRHALKIDLTDDYLDPRRGVRLNLSYQNVPANTVNDPEYYRIDSGISLYTPMHHSDTLVLNYYRSDAHVTSQGNIDPTEIRQELPFQCSAADSACLSAEQALVDSYIAARSYGTATPLGGENRLRAYPRERFNGAHMAFAGAEYRWNFIQDAKPFNYFIWKDVTTSMQLAFFYEAGTVSELASDLWKENRRSYGIGGRLVSASGSVYRADFATGDEGNQFTIFFFYPWK